MNTPPVPINHLHAPLAREVAGNAEERWTAGARLHRVLRRLQILATEIGHYQLRFDRRSGCGRRY
jgi:hypothetical protein